MTLQTFGPVLVQDPRTKKGVPVTTAVVTDPFTGDPIPTFDLDGNARTVTTDARGIAGQWQADTSAGVLALDFGGVQLHQISLEFAAGAQAAAEAAQAAAEAAQAASESAQAAAETAATEATVPTETAITNYLGGSMQGAKSSGEAAPTLTPLIVETLTTGLIDTTPANLRAGLPTTTYASPSGGYTTELAIAVTGTKGSAVLTSSESAKVAGLGSAPFEAVLNSTDGKSDLFVTVLSNNGSTQITLLDPLAADFTGTIASKYNDALGQHLTRDATKAYAQHALSKVGLYGSRGRIIDGAFAARPIGYQGIWSRNAALVTYGTSNSAAPVVRTDLVTGSSYNLRGFDGLAQVPTGLPGAVQIGTHLSGHGASGTVYPRRQDTVLEFYVSAFRSGATVSGAQIRVQVTADSTVVFDKTFSRGAVKRVAVPLYGVDKATISVTNTDGNPYYILLSQTTLREAGAFGGSRAPLRKIVTLGDSWFAFYNGQFAASLAAKSGATVINHALGGMTTYWALDWFDTYVLAEKPDECWFHFFTNDANALTGTFTASDGSSKPLWPTGSTGVAAQAEWRANILLLAKRCRDAGIKPVIIAPGGTASQAQAQKHAEWAAYLDRPALIPDFASSSAELADPAAYVNTIAKVTGAAAMVGTSRRVAQGPNASDAWKNNAEDAIIPLQKKTLTLSSYTVATGVAIGTDTNSDGLSDGLSLMAYSTITGDTYTPSIVGGNQRMAYSYAASGATGNQRVRMNFSATAGKDYLVIFDIVNGTASTPMADSYSDLVGIATGFNTNGSWTLDASGAGILSYRATSSATGSKYAAVAMLRSNGNSRTFDIRKAVVVDVAALLADAPNLANSTTTELAAFCLGIKP